MTEGRADIPANLEVLLAEFAASGVRELYLRQGEFELFLSSDAAASWHATGPAASPPPAQPTEMPAKNAPASAAPRPAPQSASVQSSAPPMPTLPDNAYIITAPNLGTFYRAPKPGAPPYVDVGSAVRPGDEVCLIEVMKLFTAVTVDVAGSIHAILVEDGAMVDAGQPLFALVRD